MSKVKIYVVDLWDGTQWHVATNPHNDEPSVHLRYTDADAHRRTFRETIKSLPGHNVRIRPVEVDLTPPALTERGTEHDR